LQWVKRPAHDKRPYHGLEAERAGHSSYGQPWRIKKLSWWGYVIAPAVHFGAMFLNKPGFRDAPVPRVMSDVGPLTQDAGFVFSGDLGHGPLIMERIAERIVLPTAGIKRETYLSCGLSGVVQAVVETLELTGGQSFVRGLDGNEHVVWAAARDRVPTSVAHIESYDSRVISNPTKPTTGKYYIRLVVPAEKLAVVEKALDEKLHRAKVAVVTWWYEKRGGHSEKTLTLDEPRSPHDTFYPWIKEGLPAFVRAFLDSSATILFMYGPPGTGKTSLLRWIIWHASLHAMVTYDEQLLAADEMLVSFIDSDEVDMLVVEDADTMLTARDHGGNKVVARYLGASDGIVKFPRKKLVFTTNLLNLSDIDKALLREGRCFGVLRFRALTFDEAVAAASAAGLKIPTVRRDYTLAELFNQSIEKPDVVEIGFSRHAR
jgi:hypothetical protein